jgi:hypothetical protein
MRGISSLILANVLHNMARRAGRGKMQQFIVIAMNSKMRLLAAATREC